MERGRGSSASERRRHIHPPAVPGAAGSGSMSVSQSENQAAAVGSGNLPREEIGNISSQNIFAHSNEMEDLDFDQGVGNEYDREDREDTPQSKKRVRKEVSSRSQYWEHFDKYFCDVEKLQKARCKYCARDIKADPKIHGTTSLKNHFESCKKKPHEVATNQTRIGFQTSSQAGESHMVAWKFDQTKVREALRYWLIVDELPFKTVDNIGFRYFMSIACPMFMIPSRRTVTRDIYKFYVDEKESLKTFIKKYSQRVSITTDTWTSIQRVNYNSRYKSGGRSEYVKSELEKYLSEDLEEDNGEFNILKWWKENSHRFPILSKIARDILGVPVSTVASEAAFSTGGRVLDAFRSSLSPRIVQALLCAQDWLRLNANPLTVEEDLSEVELIDQELSKLGIDSSIVDI